MKNNVKELRKKKAITQVELAKIVGVTKFHICRVEKEKVNMSVPLATRIANALDVTLNDIFFDDTVV